MPASVVYSLFIHCSGPCNTAHSMSSLCFMLFIPILLYLQSSEIFLCFRSNGLNSSCAFSCSDFGDQWTHVAGSLLHGFFFLVLASSLLILTSSPSAVVDGSSISLYRNGDREATTYSTCTMWTGNEQWYLSGPPGDRATMSGCLADVLSALSSCCTSSIKSSLIRSCH